MSERPANLLTVLIAVLAVLTACASPAKAEDPKPADNEPTKQPADKTDNDNNSKPADKPKAGNKPNNKGEEKKADPAVVDLLEKIEKAASTVDTLRSRVRYTREQTLTGDKQVRYGEFYYAASIAKVPAKYAILFDRMVVDGKGRVIKKWFIFDGNWLLERDEKEKTATRRELVPQGKERADTLNLGDGQLPIPLRPKADKVLETYEVERKKDEKTKKGQSLVRLKLTPKVKNKKNEDPAVLELWFDAKTLMLYKVRTTEDADEIEILLSLPKPNAQIDSKVFSTVPPKSKGWQVQEVKIKG